MKRFNVRVVEGLLVLQDVDEIGVPARRRSNMVAPLQLVVGLFTLREQVRRRAQRLLLTGWSGSR